MKYFITMVLLLTAATTMAQQKQAITKDTPAVKMIIKNNVQRQKAAAVIPVEIELNNIVAAYTNYPNTAVTWTKIIAAADNVLYTYFRDGKLLGTKKEQAYYIKMGTATMTAADITNKKMILIAGIAPNKPADFIVIKISKNCN
jgi:hypothetical protein